MARGVSVGNGDVDRVYLSERLVTLLDWERSRLKEGDEGRGGWLNWSEVWAAFRDSEEGFRLRKLSSLP